MNRRKLLRFVGLVAIVVALFALLYRPFPSDKTPEGAYMRIARSMAMNKPLEIFPYLENEAQWASYSIRDSRKEAKTLVLRSYPEPAKTEWLTTHGKIADAPDGSDAFYIYSEQRGLLERLKKDLSGVDRVDIDGERATVVTARGTRYAFRKRPNGIWGLTLFSAELIAERNRAERDLSVIRTAAADYDRVKGVVAPLTADAGR
ncbi:MAG: hypothetical protein U0174_21610 [Polyangiaceae bacterium]